MTKLVLKVKGMHCASCSTLIDKLIGAQPGVHSINTNYGAEKTALEFDETKITLEKVDGLLHKLGYDLIRPDEQGMSVEEEEKKEARQIAQARRRVVASFALAGPIIIYYMLIHMLNLKHVHQFYGVDLNYVYWILSTPIQFIIAWPFYRNAFTAARVGSANMDVLVVLGTSDSYFYSMIGFLFFGIDHPFWESSAALLSFILLGRYFEVVAKGRASAAIKELLKLEAKEAHVMRGGSEQTIPLDQIRKGDIVVVRPGEKIPVDGVILEGKTHLDEKVVTGESYPVSKTIGDEVIGATMNQEGFIQFRATKVGKETLLYQIIQMVEEAQATRAPIQNLVDKISERFVPAVIVFAVITFVTWYFIFPYPFAAALRMTIAVLVISCPCAMGLATPTALIVGIGRAAKFGIILKGGEALEKAYKITAIAFDKTGTLTIGKPVVTDFVALEPGDEQEMMRVIAALETGSEHPLARAIVEKGKAISPILPPLKDFQAIAGMGAQGKVGRKEVAIGNIALMNALRVTIPAASVARAEELQAQAKTVVYAAFDRKLVALLALADALKPFAREAIAALKAAGKEIIMITGDNPKTAQAIAGELRIDRVLAQVLPQQKAEVIARLQKEGKIVAMVGDGINDSPALAKADVGIAVGSGTDVAVQTGQIVLVKDDLRDVVTAIQLSGKTIRKVWQNLFWAFIYNVVAIPIASGLHLFFTTQILWGSASLPAAWILPLKNGGAFAKMIFNFLQATLRPEIAGFAMAFSSVSVVTNSLLLRRYTPEMEKESS